MTMTPAAFIHARRKALGISLFDLADATEMTRERIKGIEAGARPDYHEAERIAAAINDEFDVLHDLLDGRIIRLCAACGCGDHDIAALIDGLPRHWSGPDLCTACADPSLAILAFDPEARRYFAGAQ